MSEGEQIEVVTEDRVVRFRVGVRRQGDALLSISAWAKLPGGPNIRWDRLAFSKDDETGDEKIVFASSAGSTAVVDVDEIARVSVDGLRLYDETILRLRRIGQPARALLWACVIERLAALGLVDDEDGGRLDMERLSADLLSACKEGGCVS